MCGGPSPAQERATESQTGLSNTMAGIARQREAYQGPYLQSRVQGGLPFRDQLLDFNQGTLARSFAPQEAALRNRLSASGNALPSGFATQSLMDFGAKKGRAFDDSVVQALMLDEEARARAAGLANPIGYFGGAQQGYGSVMNLPQQQSPWGAIAGGAIQGLIGATACWIAEAVYGKSDFRVPLLRAWLNQKWGVRGIGRPVMWAYRKWGRQVAPLVAQSPTLRRGFRYLFDIALVKSGGA